jgi:hypothetical protein
VGPPPGAAIRGGELAYALGLGKLFLVSVPDSLLRTIAPVMNALIESWPIAEFGSMQAPEGHGPFAAMMTMWNKLNGQAGGFLAGFKVAGLPGIHADSATLAAAVVALKRFQQQGLQIAPVFQGIGVQLGGLSQFRKDSLANVNLRIGLLLTRMSQMVLFTRNLQGGSTPGELSFGTAFGATPGAVQYVDPITPTQTSQLGMGGGGFLSRLFKSVGDGQQQNAQDIAALGGSFLFPVQQFQDVFTNLRDGLGGMMSAVAALASEAGLPPVVVEVRNGPQLDWIPVSDSVVAQDSVAELRVRCPSCPNLVPEAGPDVAAVTALDTTTRAVSSQSGTGGLLGLSGMLRVLPSGARGKLLGAVLGGFQGLQGLLGAVYKMIVPVTVPVRKDYPKLTPDSQMIALGDTADFSLSGGLTASLRHEWDFGDGSSKAISNVGQLQARHEYGTAGTYTATATGLLRLGNADLRVARATGKVVVVNPLPVWKISSLRLDSATGAVPNPSLDPLNRFTIYGRYFAIRKSLGAVEQGVRDGYVHYRPAGTPVVDRLDRDADGNRTELMPFPEAAWIQFADSVLGPLPPGFDPQLEPWPWGAVPTIGTAILVGALPEQILNSFPVGWSWVHPTVPFVGWTGSLQSGELNGLHFANWFWQTALTPPNPSICPGGGTLFHPTEIHGIQAAKNDRTLTGTLSFDFRRLTGNQFGHCSGPPIFGEVWGIYYSFTAQRVH